MFDMLLMFILSFLVLFLFNLISEKDQEDEFLGVYECGFDSIVETRVWFSYRFFLLATLFVVFDAEISIMLAIPYVVEGGTTFLILVWMFILVLTVGIFYEMEVGSLDWV